MTVGSRTAAARLLAVLLLVASTVVAAPAASRLVDPLGPENYGHVRTAMHCSSAVVFAWGAWPDADYGIDVYAIAAERNIEPLCLGVTKDGAPRHPLYVRADQPLVPFRRSS